MRSNAAHLQSRRTIMATTPTLDKLVDDLNNYPEAHLELEFINIIIPGSQLNESETVEFQVKAHNHGPMTVLGLQLEITGLNGTTVAQNIIGAPFVDSITTLTLPTLAGHGGSAVTPGAPYKFKAPSSPRSTQDLVKVTVGEWQADWDHPLKAHSDPSGTVQAVYRDDVLAS
jgi:hypothetical protein